MAASLSSQATETLKTLRDQLGRLEDGSLGIGEFSDWFTSRRWDSSAGFNTTELAPLGWGIETALMEYEIYPDGFEAADLIDVFERVCQQANIDLPEGAAATPDFVVGPDTVDLTDDSHRASRTVRGMVFEVTTTPLLPLGTAR